MIMSKKFQNYMFLVTMLIVTSCISNKAKPKENNSENNTVSFEDIYNNANKAYDIGDYQESAKQFDLLFENTVIQFTQNIYYNGACSYALNNEKEKAISYLEHVINELYYDNLNHITSDTDLISLHSHPKWTTLLVKIEKNIASAPERKRMEIKQALFETKQLLEKDDGTLWGFNLWDSKILIIDFDKTIYSLEKLLNSTTKDSIVFFKKFEGNELSFTNTTQYYQGVSYATLLINYINNKSVTLIHEIFHLQHFRKMKENILQADPVDYLDKHDARILLRLEFEALRNALKETDKGQPHSNIKAYINDALLFRKLRQKMNISHLQAELEIETVEGLANYTGIKLSGVNNKLQRAIKEINSRENAKTYTRPFPYATGPAYGLLFDHLKINWRKELDKVYNFYDIYFTTFPDEKKENNTKQIELAKSRNNFKNILKEEIERKQEFDKNVAYYNNMFFNHPTLKAKVNHGYNQTYNMYGTLVLEGIGTVFSGFTGVDNSGNNFGNFKIISGKDKLGVAGILKLTEKEESNQSTFLFPLPNRIENNMIYGDFYEIELNEGWYAKKINDKGDMEIVKK